MEYGVGNGKEREISNKKMRVREDQAEERRVHIGVMEKMFMTVVVG